jgi:hypothetical protein
MQYIQKIEQELKLRGITAKKMLLELGYSDNLISQWKKGAVPSVDRIIKIADYLDVSADYLMASDETASDEKLAPSNLLLRIRGVLFSTPQRVASLRNGVITAEYDDLLPRITEYLGCPQFYLLGVKCDYAPPQRTLNDLDSTILMRIFDILDRPAADEAFAVLQLRISYIIRYHLENKGITKEALTERCRFHPAKVNYIWEGTKSLDPTLNYGFNFSDFLRILDDFGTEYKLTPIYLLTGVEGQ